MTLINFKLAYIPHKQQVNIHLLKRQYQLQKVTPSTHQHDQVSVAVTPGTGVSLRSLVINFRNQFASLI